MVDNQWCDDRERVKSKYPIAFPAVLTYLCIDD